MYLFEAPFIFTPGLMTEKFAPRYSSYIITCVVSTYSAGPFLFYLFSHLYFHLGITLHWMFFGYITCVCVLPLISLLNHHTTVSPSDALACLSNQISHFVSHYFFVTSSV